MLSFVETSKNSLKIAEVYKGDKKQYDVFIVPEDKTPAIFVDNIDEIIELIDDYDYEELIKRTKIKSIELQYLRKNIRKYKDFNDVMRSHFDILMSIINDKLKYELHFDKKYKVKYFFDTSQHCNIFISGKSGSGKTFWAKDLLKSIDDKDIIYIAPPELKGHGDHSIDELREKGNFFYISIDDFEDINKLPHAEEMANKILVFDDLDTSTDKELVKYIIDYRDKALMNLRKASSNIIVISHYIRNYKHTLVPRSECVIHVIYPRDNINWYMKYLQDQYNFPKKYRDLIKKNSKKSRWLLIKQQYPSFVMGEKFIMLF